MAVRSYFNCHLEKFGWISSVTCWIWDIQLPFLGLTIKYGNAGLLLRSASDLECGGSARLPLVGHRFLIWSAVARHRFFIWSAVARHRFLIWRAAAKLPTAILQPLQRPENGRMHWDGAGRC